MSRHRSPPEFKDEAVRQIIEAGHSIGAVADRLGVSGHNVFMKARDTIVADVGDLKIRRAVRQMNEICDTYQDDRWDIPFPPG